MPSSFCSVKLPYDLTGAGSAVQGLDGSPAIAEDEFYDLLDSNRNIIASNITEIPVGLSNGTYYIRYTFNEQDVVIPNDPFLGPFEPGCTQAYEQSFMIREINCGTFPWNGN